MSRGSKGGGGAKGRGGKSQGSGGGSGGGGGASKSDRGERGGSGGRSNGPGSDSGSSGGSKSGNGKRKGRDIKNARSLSDVLGGGAKKSSSSGGRGFSPAGGPSREENQDRRHAFNREAGSGSSDTSNSNSGSRSSYGSDSPNTANKKLQYIMTFTPPEQRNQSAPAGRDVPREPQRDMRREPQRETPREPSREPSREPVRSRFDVEPAAKSGGGKKPSPAREKFLAREQEKPDVSSRQSSATRPMRPDPRINQKSSSSSQQTRSTPVAPVKPGPSGGWPKDRLQPKAQNEEHTGPRHGRGGRPDARVLSGIIKRHPDGFGFLITDDADSPDVYVARQSMTGIMTNDRVEVELYTPRGGKRGGREVSSSKEDRLSGEIVNVLSRANTRVVGRYLPVDKKYGMLQDENRGWGADLRIAADDTMGAKEGELIAVEITQYPDDDHEFMGKVVSVIGDSEDPVNDVIRVVHQAGIPTEFSEQAVADAAKFGGKVTEQERRGREDLTGLDLITIDGVTAKDFDDAVFTEQTSSGFRLVVAIADVSHYVKPGSRLDEEAYERGTSTYFPNFVVPMLPEELSNELCSLKPHVLRLCFCCEMNIGYDGTIEKYRFFEGVMESKARVTYGEAQEVIDSYANGEERTNKTAQKLEHVHENILRSADLAKILMQKRFRDGSLDLEIPETQVVVDSSGESTDIIRASRLFAHRLIEELMLATNICTARFMDEHEIPGIYRVHEEPDPDNIKNLQRFLWNMGGSKSVMGGNLAKKLTSALESMQGKPEAQILNILTLRTMQQAHYSEQNVGHFGLGFTHYSHFTSPIRRYPDLIAHRIIKSQIYDKYKSMGMEEEEIQSATTWLSATEQRSTKAERKVISIKKARFIRRFEGEEFEGMISSVAKFGVFVLLRQYDVDGLVKVERLGNDRFEFDEENLRLVGRKSGIQYTIGDVLKVRVMGADIETGKVDFELVDVPVPKSKSGSGAIPGEGDLFDDEGPVSGKRPSRRDGKREPERKSGSRDASKEGPKGGLKVGRRQARGQKGQQRKADSAAPEPKKKSAPAPGRGSQPEKRSAGPNDRSGVRKKRLSKRR